MAVRILHGADVTGERNALFAELLVTTGLRLEEAASLLATEMPTPDRVPAKQRSLSFRLPAAIAKGGRAREIRLPVRLLRRLADYIAIERANALGKRRSVLRRPIIGVDAARATIGIVGKEGEVYDVRLDLLGPTERKRLITPAGEPMALWLNEVGRPMTAEAWAAVFRRASERCCNLGIDLNVTRMRFDIPLRFTCCPC